MVPPRSFFLLGLTLGSVVFGPLASAQTVVNSIFLNRYPEPALYSDPNNWSPAEVPNNTGAKNYNVNISPGFAVDVDTDATVSNLTLFGLSTGLHIREKSLSVTGTTKNELERGYISINASASAEASFNAGTLSRFSNNTLSGDYLISSLGRPATLQFQHAAISTVSGGLFLSGPLARIVDEFGNDALLNLARVESGATLSIGNRSLATNAAFSNAGSLSIGQGKIGSSFTAAGGLTNFDPATRTITNGNFAISGFDPLVPLAELRFNGADIVTNGSVIQLIGPRARIADLAGNDGLRNLARTHWNGVLLLSQHDFTIPGQFQNDGSLRLLGGSIFTVAGGLGNFDPTTRIFRGGAFQVTDNSQLKFAGADIVHNGAQLTISEGGMITDLAGNDGLRNFNDNLSNGEFIVGTVEFRAPGDFTNAGKVETKNSPGRLTVPSGFRYTQTGGTTLNEGVLTADHIEILGGSIQGRGTFLGNVTVTNATIIPFPTTMIQGDLTLKTGSAFHFQLYSQPQHEISGKVTLAGTLEVDIPSDRSPSSTTFLTILKSAQPLSGVFSNAPNGARIFTTDGKGSVVVTYGTNEVIVSQYQLEPPAAQLLNISSRAFLPATADDAFHDRAVIIGGFIVSGSAPKDIVLRGLGPSLAQSGLDPILADPVVELHASDGALIGSNDDWKENEAAITASGLAPGSAREAALRVTLDPGTYTAVVKEKSGRAGYGLVEIYDLSQNTTSKLANISTRGFTDSNSVLIGGIIVAGSGQANDDVVVRALGPQLQQHGIANALDDPTLEVRDENGNLMSFNDDWNTNSAQISSTGLTPFNNSESAVRLSLPPGSYTAIVRAKANSSGVALVEFYDLRR